MKIILASTSPRRKSLLKKAGFEFEIISPTYDEEFQTLEFSFEKIKEVSLNKALSVKKVVPEDAVIISADTVVVFDGKIMLKPKDRQDAYNMLKKLSGNEHFVVTGYTVMCPKTSENITSYVKSIVKFSALSDEQINSYIDNFNPMDKAGAYGLQELPEYFGAKTIGSVNNVIGLPVEEIIADLKKLTIS